MISRGGLDPLIRKRRATCGRNKEERGGLKTPIEEKMTKKKLPQRGEGV